ncbi:hypothetical protein [Corallococcus sp. AS-1-12]|uniref:hypothetical protein n=1 Tax=Corallococcus sp. AS-1-12 TaxID=2874598 RepID=UPI001CC10403|nr:hypothetical protein [Corallococcus sp. AS-1-12]MBZ4331040.1 hypothetical protein [Corallococcus sp. AS-1-12]
MSHYAATSTFIVAAFTRQQEGGEVIIGLPAQGVFLALPPDAVELLDQLREGRTLAEAEAFYVSKYGEVPDAQGLIEALEPRGFLRDATRAVTAQPPPESAPRTDPVRYHFAGFPRGLAQALFGPWALGAYGALIMAAVASVVLRPSILPGWSSLAVSQHMTVTLLVLLALNYGMLFLHEMAHLVAARAVGVPCRLGISHRLWILVAETDMTGVWGIPRRQRYLPFLAGPLLDLVLMALSLLTLFAQAQGWVSLALQTQWLLRASLLMLAFRVLWQFQFFLRTDMYCVFVNLFGCKNLMGDTEALLKHRVRGLLRSRPPEGDPLEAVPPAERRVIHVYAGFWVLGRLLAFALLFGVQLPVALAYVRSIHHALASPGDHVYAVVDALVLGTVGLGTLGVGLFLWLRGIARDRSGRKRAAAALSQTVALE